MHTPDPSGLGFSKKDNTCSGPMFQDHNGAKMESLSSSGAEICWRIEGHISTILHIFELGNFLSGRSCSCS